MSRQISVQTHQQKPTPTSSVSGLLQRRHDFGPHTIAGGELVAYSNKKRSGLQTQLKINEPGDIYEQEADRIAEQVMAMPVNPNVGGIPRSIQRFSGGVTGQRDTVTASVDQALASPGRQLEPSLRHDMEQRFGYDFSSVRIHTNEASRQSALEMNAKAYTVGQNIVFGTGQFVPFTPIGLKLLAHELTHVIQQSSHFINSTLNTTHLKSVTKMRHEQPTLEMADQIDGKRLLTTKAISPVPSGNTIQRVRIGSRVTHPSERPSPYTRVQAEFDGREFAASGDGSEFLRENAQSGRPIAVREPEVRICSGDLTDTYMNNPRYVGISDNGPIPEGEYTFRVSEMATFNPEERWDMLFGGSFTDPFGRSMHGGDWGSGRVPLHPRRILPSRIPGCGDTRQRSGFYLHGGIMPGSSGCIDIGNDGYDSLVSSLLGYRAPVQVTVRYRHEAAFVGPFGRMMGGFTYPEEEEPGIISRVLSGIGQGGLEGIRREMACMEGCEDIDNTIIRSLCQSSCHSHGDR